MFQKEGNKANAYCKAKIEVFLGQLRDSSKPQLRDICLSTSRFLNLSLEKWFNYACVSMENWLILVILGLLLLLGSKKWPTMGLFDKPESSRSYQWGQMIWLDTIWGSEWVFLGCFRWKKWIFYPKRTFWSTYGW